MKLNAPANTHHRHVLALTKTLAKRLDEELSRNPMVPDCALVQLIEETVADKIDIVRLIGRKDSNKELLVGELQLLSETFKAEARNRFRKKAATTVDLTVVEADRAEA